MNKIGKITPAGEDKQFMKAMSGKSVSKINFVLMRLLSLLSIIFWVLGVLAIIRDNHIAATVFWSFPAGLGVGTSIADIFLEK
jgi:hypothetical protein